MGGENVGLRINIKEMKILKGCDPGEGTVDTIDEPTEEVDSFRYLGSIVANDGGAEKDLIT